MVSDPFLVGVFFGLVPGMATLYLVLHRYEGLFFEKRAFFAFFVGLGVGLVATLMQLFLRPPTGALHVQFGFTVLYGIVNAAMMAAILNHKRYRGRPDTPFYALALGLGFGAMSVLFFIGFAVQRLTGRDVLVDTLAIVFLGLYFIGSLFVHASSAVWIGIGTSRGGLPRQILKACAAESVYQASFLLLFHPQASAIVPPLMLGLSIALLGHVIRRDLDGIIPPEIKRELEIHRRRLARRKVREATQASDTGPAEARTGDSPIEEAPGSDPRTPPP